VWFVPAIGSVRAAHLIFALSPDVHAALEAQPARHLRVPDPAFSACLEWPWKFWSKSPDIVVSALGGHKISSRVLRRVILRAFTIRRRLHWHDWLWRVLHYPLKMNRVHKKKWKKVGRYVASIHAWIVTNNGQNGNVKNNK
jgi:hypothetical protein